MKTPDRNDLKLGTVVVLDSLSMIFILGSKGQGQGHRVVISNFRHPFKSLEWTQLQSSNFVHALRAVIAREQKLCMTTALICGCYTSRRLFVYVFVMNRK